MEAQSSLWLISCASTSKFNPNSSCPQSLHSWQTMRSLSCVQLPPHVYEIPQQELGLNLGEIGGRSSCHHSTPENIVMKNVVASEDFSGVLLCCAFIQHGCLSFCLNTDGQVEMKHQTGKSSSFCCVKFCCRMSREIYGFLQRANMLTPFQNKIL